MCPTQAPDYKGVGLGDFDAADDLRTVVTPETHRFLDSSANMRVWKQWETEVPLVALLIILALAGCQQIYSYHNAPEAKIKLWYCGGDFRLRSKDRKMLVIPYTATELTALACDSDTLEARAVKAVEEHFSNRQRRRLYHRAGAKPSRSDDRGEVRMPQIVSAVPGADLELPIRVARQKRPSSIAGVLAGTLRSGPKLVCGGPQSRE